MLPLNFQLTGVMTASGPAGSHNGPAALGVELRHRAGLAQLRGLCRGARRTRSPRGRGESGDAGSVPLGFVVPSLLVQTAPALFLSAGQHLPRGRRASRWTPRAD